MDTSARPNQRVRHQQAAINAANLRAIHIPAVEKYAYCLCLHVKPATIFIALIKLIKTLILSSMILNDEIAFSERELESTELRHKSTAAAISIAMLIVVASISAVAIYAVLSNRSALLMPLYAIMLCDFFFSLPATYSREPNFTDSTFDTGIRDYGPHPNTTSYRYYSFVLATFDLLIKIYFLCVVWKCYRYLRLRELITPLRLAAEIYPHIHHIPPHAIVRISGSDTTDIVSSASLAPPSYDAIVTSLKNQPPDYEDAIKSSNNDFSAVVVVDETSQPRAPQQQQQQQNQNSLVSETSLPTTQDQQKP